MSTLDRHFNTHGIKVQSKNKIITYGIIIVKNHAGHPWPKDFSQENHKSFTTGGVEWHLLNV